MILRNGCQEYMKILLSSTGVACINTNRNFIGIELDETYFNIAKTRIEEVQNDIHDNER